MYSWMKSLIIGSIFNKTFFSYPVIKSSGYQVISGLPNFNIDFFSFWSDEKNGLLLGVFV